MIMCFNISLSTLAPTAPPWSMVVPQCVAFDILLRRPAADHPIATPATPPESELSKLTFHMPPSAKLRGHPAPWRGGAALRCCVAVLLCGAID